MNLTSLIPVILTVLDSWYHFSSMRQNTEIVKTYYDITIYLDTLYKSYNKARFY
jgi:hypothetical protein